MNNVIKSMAVTSILVLCMLWTANAFAAPPIPVPQGPPVWCYGLNDLDQCVLFLGTEQSCKNINPCNTFSAAPRGGTIPVSSDLWFCMGEDEFGRCQLFAGSEEACKDVTPCKAIIGQLPRLPKLRAAE